MDLAQLTVPEKSNEIAAIPDLLNQLAAANQFKGALVSVDAISCRIEIAGKIVAHKTNDLLAVKGNQPTLETDMKDYSAIALATELVGKITVEKERGRMETSIYTASSNIDWIAPSGPIRANRASPA